MGRLLSQWMANARDVLHPNLGAFLATGLLALYLSSPTRAGTNVAVIIHNGTGEQFTAQYLDLSGPQRISNVRSLRFQNAAVRHPNSDLYGNTAVNFLTNGQPIRDGEDVELDYTTSASDDRPLEWKWTNTLDPPSNENYAVAITSKNITTVPGTRTARFALTNDTPRPICVNRLRFSSGADPALFALVGRAFINPSTSFGTATILSNETLRIPAEGAPEPTFTLDPQQSRTFTINLGQILGGGPAVDPPSLDQVQVFVRATYCLPGFPNNTTEEVVWSAPFASQSKPTVVATIPVGGAPNDAAVDPTTNRVYVADLFGRVAVIDGNTNAVITYIPVGLFPVRVAVNPATHRVYVTNLMSSTVSVIDGNFNRVIATIGAGSSPSGVAVNPRTNRVYVADEGTNRVWVIDGNTNSLSSPPIQVGSLPGAVAVNPVTNRIYVTNRNSNTVSVIDGTTNLVIRTIAVGSFPAGAALNLYAKRLYISNYNSDTVSVIDGDTNNFIWTTAVGVSPVGIGADLAGLVYVAHNDSNDVRVIDGATNAVSGTIRVGSVPDGLGVNLMTSRAYVANRNSGTVSVIGSN